MPGSNNSVISVPAPVQPHPVSEPVLHPAARGSLLCFCRGEVVEMRSQYGWLKVYGEVDHPLAAKHDGHIFVHKPDIVHGMTLTPGDLVTFYLYADGKGLGAEGCKAVGSSSHGREAQCMWPGSDPWSSARLHSQLSSHGSHNAIYYMPYNVVIPGPCGTQPPTMACNLKQDQNSEAGATTNPPVAEKTCAVQDDASFDGTRGELPSVGSAGHSDGSCKRCAFFPKGRCVNGRDCTHCHFDHTMRTRLRKRKQCRTRQDESESAASMHVNDSEQGGEKDELSNLARIGTVLITSMSSSHEQQSESDDMTSEDDTDDREDISQKGDAATATTCASSSSASDNEECLPACEVLSEALSAVDEKWMHGKESSEASDSEISTSFDCTSTSKSEDGDVTDIGSPKLSWSAQQRLRRARSTSDEVSTAEIERMARSLLNKLTHERFESLSAQILALPFSTSEQLAVLVAQIFEKATTQAGFRSLYTDLCIRLDAHLLEQQTAVGGKAFRKALANECQASFERYLQPPNPILFSGLTGDECFEVEMKLKTQRLGNMRFIGDLLSNRLLAQKLMPPIILQLLDGDEAALESLVALLMVVAPVFDRKDSVYGAPMRDAFATLRRRKSQKETSSRLRCHLSDLFDARARGWAPRTA